MGPAMRTTTEPRRAAARMAAAAGVDTVGDNPVKRHRSDGHHRVLHRRRPIRVMSQPGSYTAGARRPRRRFSARSRGAGTRSSARRSATGDRLRRDRVERAICRSGWTDEQDGGHYRLRRRDDEALFGYAVGPHSWKRYQLPPEVRLWRARRGDGRRADRASRSPRARRPRYAFLGARSCELHAMGILDRVLLGGAHPDPATAPRREDVFVVAVQCGAGGRHVLLRLDGHRPDGRSRLRPRADRGARRTAATTSSSRSAATRGADGARRAAARARRRGRAAAPPRPRTRAPRRRWAASSTSPTSGSCSTATTSIRAGTRSPSAA